MSKLKNLEHKVVWITGASSGLGKALAQECARQGAQVVLSARRYDELEKVRLTLNEPEQHLSLAFDITQQSQVEHAYSELLASRGRIDWLINNAGLSQRALIQDTTMQTERTLMEVDYFSQIFLTKIALATFIQQRAGRIVFISSVAGLLGTQYRASYSAAKAAIHIWANSLRAEMAEFQIDVSVVFPGFVKTNVSYNALNGQGLPQGHQDDAIENGLDADFFAKEVVKALMNDQQYIVVGGAKEKLGVWASRLAPHVLYKMIRNIKVK